MTVVLKKPLSFAYEGHRIVHYAIGTELADTDPAAAHALEYGYGETAKAAKPSANKAFARAPENK